MQGSDLKDVHVTADGEIHEPSLGVHVLTKFAFCPRAGLCAHETGADEPDETPPVSFFGFNPLYSIGEIECALERHLNEMKIFVVAAAVAAIVAFILTSVVNRLTGLGGVAAMFYFLVMSFHRAVQAYFLYDQLKVARAAQKNEPDPQATDVQNVYWWDLLQAGFEMQPANDWMVDGELNFSGRPRRFLRRGNTIIPVWRMLRYKGQLYPQNFIRMAAYCRLVQASSGAGVDCPYGVILLGRTFFGVTIPFTKKNESDLFGALAEARSVIADSVRRRSPPPPAPALCSSCPFGKPAPYKTNHVCKGKTLTAIVALDPKRKQYHSFCGDRFRWLPPHDDVEKKDLLLTS